MPRILLHELSEMPNVTSAVASISGISAGEALEQLQKLNGRLRAHLGFENDPIRASSSGGWIVDGVAGLVRLNSVVELEIVPKFLNPDSGSWRTDFFLLAVLDRTGHLFLGDEITSGVEDRGDLALLVARALLISCARNEHRPVRGYRRAQELDFSLDGDVDWETVFLPDPDGFENLRLELSRRNTFNSVIFAAARILLSEVSDSDIHSRLTALVNRLGQQDDLPSFFPPLPPRYFEWQRAYDIAKMVVEGSGVGFAEGQYEGPGFVLSTWKAWQSLCEELLRRALPRSTVLAQHKWYLGRRGAQPVFVRPDISPLEGKASLFLADAKYKTRFDRSPRISSSDLYESLAFLYASRSSYMTLLYPSADSVDVLKTGGWRAFDRVDVDHRAVEGFEIQIQGLAGKGGFDKLVVGAREALAAFA